MEQHGITLRGARPEDVPALFDVRTSVRENLLTTEQMAAMGITPASVTASLAGSATGWVAEADGRVVGFVIADRGASLVFALFVRPGYEGRGVGRRLLAAAVAWLGEQGAAVVSLTTHPDSRAAGFYRRLGWQEAGTRPNGEVCFRLRLR